MSGIRGYSPRGDPAPSSGIPIALIVPSKPPVEPLSIIGRLPDAPPETEHPISKSPTAFSLGSSPLKGPLLSAPKFSSAAASSAEHTPTRGLSPRSGRSPQSGRAKLPDPIQAPMPLGRTWTAVSLVALVVCDFSASGPYQLSLLIGDLVRIVEQSEHWYRGVKMQTRETGIFPKTYIWVVRCQHSDPADSEFHKKLREWFSSARLAYKEKRWTDFSELKTRLRLELTWARSAGRLSVIPPDW